MDTEENRTYRNVGLFLAATSAVFLVAIGWHGAVHPFAGASPEQSLPLVQERASSWFAMHFFFAIAAILLSSASLGVVNLRSYLTDSLLGLAGWLVLAVLGILLAGLVIMEATVQGDAAVAGNLDEFAMWMSLSRGAELLFILFPLALIAIAVTDFSARAPLTPRWASALALVGAVLIVPAIIGASGFRVVALGRLWSAAALPVSWFIWLGTALRALPRTV